MTKKITFIAGESPQARQAHQTLTKLYGDSPASQADVIVVLGGDGLMLRTLHEHIDSGTPLYGMNRGSTGFLMNEYREDGLHERLDAAVHTRLHPLVMQATDVDGKQHRALAVNDVSLFRQTWQAAKLRISIDEKIRMEELVCDGILVSTPAGSTAYNLSVQGPIIPIGAQLLALTPISAFRPRRWRGALLPHTAGVRFQVIDPKNRPVSAVADNAEFRDIAEVLVKEDTKTDLLMMFDRDHSLEERILREQFIL